MEKTSGLTGITPPVSWSVADVEKWLAHHAASINNDITPKPDIDLFEQGFDR